MDRTDHRNALRRRIERKEEKLLLREAKKQLPRLYAAILKLHAYDPWRDLEHTSICFMKKDCEEKLFLDRQYIQPAWGLHDSFLPDTIRCA